jgi:AcrR family transcriptional regulator
VTRIDTKTKILDAAEQLFAQKGFDATSHRSIAAAAGVNLAAIHYYFQSKEGLIRAVLTRRLRRLNEHRLALLEEVVAEATPDPPSLEKVLEAFLAPTLRTMENARAGGAVFVRILGYLFSQPDDHLWEIFKNESRTLWTRFSMVLRDILPSLPEDVLFWRAYFMIGAMAHTLAASRRLKDLSEGKCVIQDVDTVLEQLIRFAAAGFRAPVDRSEVM